MPKLSLISTRFYSQADEAGFFAALKSIRDIRNIKGIGDVLTITVPKRISEETLRNLIAICYRYRADMTQLAQFENTTNVKWFRDPKAFWFKNVFQKTPKTA